MIRIAYLLFVFQLILNSCTEEKKYIVFLPVSVINDKFLVSEGSPDFNYQLQKVLTFYKEDFRLDEKGNILILESKWKDQDLMRNYTNKANDPQWLKDHIQQ